MSSSLPRAHASLFVFLAFSCALSPGQQSNLPDAPKPSVAHKNFFARWADFYRQDWFTTPAASPSPPRRGLPSPLDSPPFPNSDWSYGGSPVIGEPDTNSYPLMTAINGATQPHQDLRMARSNAELQHFDHTAMCLRPMTTIPIASS